MSPYVTSAGDIEYRGHESFAKELDASDPLQSFRGRFLIPCRDGRELIYLLGNSLGLQPKTARAAIEEELGEWARLGVEGYFEGKTHWYTYQEHFQEPLAKLAGARPDEVVVMNTLTANLHFMMATFFRPTSTRFKIVMEHAAFPSDTYAARTQLAHHGIDPDDGLVIVEPPVGEHVIPTDAFERVLAEQGDAIALVLLGGISFLTGQVFDMARIAEAARAAGCVVGLDLAHAIGNVPLSLHDWGVDFAVWCNYKYLNAGPGAVGGCFVHERHGRNTSLPRFGGWWGNDPDTRFRMHLQPEFIPREGAEGWQVSCPPILAMAPLRASLAIFEEATLPALREKSKRLTGYLEYLLDQVPSDVIEVITPRGADERGCQLSILVRDRAKERVADFERAGVICDFREPDVVRAAPVPLYNTYHEVWRFAQILARQLG